MNTKTSNNSLFYRIAAIFMIAMLMLAAMPVASAQAAPLAAVSNPTWFSAANGTTGPVTITPAQLTCAAGANRLLVVVVTAEYNAVNVMTLTVTKGAALTQAVKTTGNTRTGVWIGYLNDAQITANAASNIVVTEPAGGNAWQSVNVHATCLTGVDQATPIVAGGTAFNSSDANTATYVFAGVPAVNTGLMIYAAGHNGSNNFAAPAGYTESFDIAGSSLRVTAGYKAVAATGNEGGTITFNSNDRYGAAVISVNPASVAPVAPNITSANATTFTVGVANTFTVTATGSPAPTFTETGALPSGVTLSAAGVLSGTPAAGTVGSYPITITASNGTLPNATQAFTLTVQKANTTTTISSDLPDPSLAGQNVVVNYAVASAGNAITRTGNVTVSDGVNNCVGTAAAGTCTLALTTGGSRPLTATYAGDANFNGSASVAAPHTVTASYILNASAGAGGTITPSGAVAVAGGANQTFNSVPNATFILSDVLVDGVSVGRANSYTFNAVAANHTIAASFDGGWLAPTAFTNVTVSTGPNQFDAFTSNNLYAVFDGLGERVDYTTFGIPAIPAGATINGIQVAFEGHNGATNQNAGIQLSWNGGTNFTPVTPARTTTLSAPDTTVILGGIADTWGRTWSNTEFTNANFRVRIGTTAPATSQIFLDQVQVKVTYTLPSVAPTVTTQAVTSIGTTTATGNGNITSLGVPNPTQYGVVWDAAVNPTVALATKTAQGAIAATGAFTSPITGLTPNTLYHVRAYATNTTGTSYGADVTFTTNQANVITSANNTSFTVGIAGTFTVTATGSPVPTLSLTSSVPALPAGITFTPTTGILAGTPAAGTGGVYALTFKAANGVSPDATQSFTLTITDGPSITSANTTSFSLGLPGTFAVTAVGSPAPTLSATGLPAGVTFTPGAPGTGTLSTLAAGPVGSYTISFTATNGTLPDATQAFTLTVKNGPIVTPNGINSFPDTGNGSISNNESILDTLNVSQLFVKFDQNVLDVTSADLNWAKSVTNPANYMLVMGSSTGVFQTVDCFGGVQAPDVAIPISSVSYNNTTFTATVNVSNPINVVGFYRLYVCGTTSIVDPANINLELAGDGVNPGTDFLINFRVQTRVAGGGGGGGGNSNNNAASSASTKATLIPVTGFAPNKVTILPKQPADKAYKSLGEIRIEIPTLGINFPIVGAMLDRNNWDLTWLKDSVAYLDGSAYPTLAGNTVLTAHVRDANKNLGPFSDIKGLQAGQQIYIHANGQVYIYQVQENTKILPSNISAAFKHEENSWITLVTCEDYNAKTELYTHRRMVRAVLISVISEK